MGEERKKITAERKKVIRGGLSPMGFSVLIISGRNYHPPTTGFDSSTKMIRLILKAEGVEDALL